VGKELAKEIHDADIPFETWLIQYRMKLLTQLLEEE
jgi:D-alanyl-D-alanine carboxypeptidase